MREEKNKMEEMDLLTFQRELGDTSLSLVVREFTMLKIGWLIKGERREYGEKNLAVFSQIMEKRYMKNGGGRCSTNATQREIKLISLQIVIL